MMNRTFLAVGIVIVSLTMIAGPGTASAAASPGPSGSSDPAVVAAVARWVTNGGKDDLNALSDDFKDLESAAGANDPARIGASCARLRDDVATAQAYDPIPDPVAQASWSAALDSYAQGAADCVSGAGSSDAGLITKASTEITRGSTELDKVTARLDEIVG